MRLLKDEIRATRMDHTSPRGLFKTICSQKEFKRYGKQEQEDAAEFLRDLFLHWKKANWTVRNIFEGWLKTEVKCENCKETSESWESSTLTTLHKEATCNETISTLLRRYIGEWELDEDNKYSCTRCSSTDVS